MSGNVCYGSRQAMEFNGGTQVFTHGNLFVQGGWTLCAAPPGVGGGTDDVYVDAPAFWTSLCGLDKCDPLWNRGPGNGTTPLPYSEYRGDRNTIVRNSTGTERGGDGAEATYFCGKPLNEWRRLTGGDEHTEFVDQQTVRAMWRPADVVARARAMLLP